MKTPGSGRKKGTPNKSTATLLEKCEAMGIDLFEAMLELAKDPDKAIRFAAIREASKYVYAQRKSLEHSGNLDPKTVEAAEQIETMSKEQQILALEEELKKMKG